MTSELLRRARDYENEHLPRIADGVLPRYHLTGGVGWINDPNGFSHYKGEYHLFFQYNPYDTKWDAMHWGHVKTRDFIRWERLPAALAPDEAYDSYGCFSGSAIELADGRHLLMYTAVREAALDDGSRTEIQTQCVAFGDGVNYEKYAGNPVITAADLPEGGSARDFRDPKIWQEDGRFFAVVGDRCPDGSGAILLYESADALSWKLAGTLAESGNRYGRMWECPDFFPLDGSYVLLTSPQEMQAEGTEFIDGNTTLCLIGQFDRERARLLRQHEQTIDYGLDFYAPQTVLTEDGRRVMIAWMQYWNSVDFRPAQDLPFFGQMTVPRELHVREGRLLQNPVDGKKYNYSKRELHRLREYSDYYCEYYHLSVVPVPHKAPSRPAYFDEKDGKPTRYNVYREDIREAFQYSCTLKDAEAYLRRLGYITDFSDRVHYRIRLPQYKHFTRLDTLDSHWTPERLSRMLSWTPSVKAVVRWQTDVPEHLRHVHFPHQKPFHIYRLYLYYCYQLGILPKKTEYKPNSPFLREELRKLDQYDRETRFLGETGIETMDELQAFIAEKQEALDQLTAERTSIQNKMRRADLETKDSLRQQKTEKTASIMASREQLKLAKSVEARSFHMQETLDLVYDNELKHREKDSPTINITQRSYER